MHAARVLRSCLGEVLSRMHARRCAALLGAVQALVVGRHLTLMELARAWPNALRVAAPLKKLDRLLGNRHLATERDRLYGAMTHWVIRQPRPVIVVDWSPLDTRGRFQLLRAGLAVGGRTLTLFERVCAAREVASPAIERALLRALKSAMPRTSRPILVTDAGFHTPWFQAVAGLGWDWVGRIRGTVLVKPENVPDTHDGWLRCETVYRRIRVVARDLGRWQIVRSRPMVSRLVLYDKPPRGRADITRYGTRARNAYSRKIAQRESDPWLLAVSPTLELTAAQVVAIYARRMQIEQSFRDLKSHRYGVGLEDSLTRQADRLATLLLIHALVCFVAWISVASATKEVVRATIAAVTRSLRAGSLSWHRVGWLLLRRERWRLDLRKSESIIAVGGDALPSG